MDNSNNQTDLFVSLILSSQKDIYVYILSLVMSPSDADDILQDTLSLMWRKFDEFEPGTNFLAWGKQIAYYRVMNYFRDNKSSKLCYDPEVIKIIESKTNQEGHLSGHKDALKECLKKLSEKYLTILKMRYIQDMSFKQMAVKYGISKQSLHRTVSRIHAILLKCIKHSLGSGDSYES